MGTIALNHKSKLESTIGRNWMYRGTTYRFTDFTEIGDQVIISTDVKALKVPIDQVGEFLKECLPAANDLPATGGQVQVAIPGVDGGIFTEITNGLLTSFREIQGSKDPKFLKEAADRARAKVQVSRAITDIAKTVISAKKNR